MEGNAKDVFRNMMFELCDKPRYGETRQNVIEGGGCLLTSASWPWADAAAQNHANGVALALPMATTATCARPSASHRGVAEIDGTVASTAL